MTDDQQPTIGELMRRMDDLVRQIERLATAINEDRQAAIMRFVTKEVYDVRHEELARRVTDLETENTTRERAADGRKWQFIFIAITLTVPVIVNLLFSINQFMSAH